MYIKHRFIKYSFNPQMLIIVIPSQFAPSLDASVNLIPLTHYIHITSTMTREQPARNQYSMTVAQRAHLREYSRLHPNMTQENLRKWVETTFQMKVSQSTISKSLSDTFKNLDSPNGFNQQFKRRRASPNLAFEQALFLQIVNYNGPTPLSGPVLSKMAHSLWSEMYPGDEAGKLKLGPSWILRFKGRFGLKFRQPNNGIAAITDNEIIVANNEAPVSTGGFYQEYEDEGLGFDESNTTTETAGFSHFQGETLANTSGLVEHPPATEIILGSNQENDGFPVLVGPGNHKLLSFREAIQCLRKIYVLEMVQKDCDPKNLSFYSSMEQIMFERMMKSYDK